MVRSAKRLDPPQPTGTKAVVCLVIACLLGTIVAPSVGLLEPRSAPTLEVADDEPSFELHLVNAPPPAHAVPHEPRHLRPDLARELPVEMASPALATNLRSEPLPAMIAAPALPEPMPTPHEPVFVAMEEPKPSAAVRAEEPAAMPEQTPPPPLGPLELTPAAEASAVQPEQDQPNLPAAKTAWPEPTALFVMLDELAQAEPPTKDWCDAVRAEFDKLHAADSLSAPEAAAALKKLVDLTPLAREIAALRQTDNGRARVMRVYYALTRRLPLYHAAHTNSLKSPPPKPPVPTIAEWDAILAEVNGKLLQHQIGPKWAKYLALSELRLLPSQGLPDEARCALAREVLRRMTSSQLTDNQLAFLRQPPFLKLAYHLMHWAHEPLDSSGLLADIERYEQEPLGSLAKSIAQQYEIGRWSLDPAEQAIAEQMNVHYRNANVRVAASGALLNRLLPAVQRMRDRVDDTIQGACVHGESDTQTQVRVLLIPDQTSWKLTLEARGHVDSTTQSSKGPATFWQDGQAQFVARKLLTIDRRNFRLYGAAAEADSDNQLRDFETDFDNIPLLGMLARSIAEQQYYDTQPAAKHEVSQKVANRAERQFNEAVDQRIDQARNEFRKRMITPLRVLDLDPTAVDMQTTAERLIARYRLAGPEQLGANTPRPQAPADSLLSVQVHQTAMNNAVQQLRLDGQRFELRELYKELTELFLQKSLTPPEDLPEEVHVTFADKDALRLDTDGGRVRLTIRLKELSHKDEHTWKDFTVRAHYVPADDQSQTNLVRDGVIELQGDRLRLGDQITLRTIFSKVLSRNRTISVINKQLAQVKETADLRVSQFTIQDGWIGIALGYRPPGSPNTPLPQAEPDMPEPKDDDAENTAKFRGGSVGPTARPAAPNTLRPR